MQSQCNTTHAIQNADSHLLSSRQRDDTQRIIVLGISGGSSLELSFHFIKKFPKGSMLYVVPSKSANILCKAEKNLNLIDEIYKIRTQNLCIESKITSKLASGSFSFESYIILPTSSNTLSRIACGLQDNLLTRVAAICLKEQRKLILAVREMPLSPILLENMHKLALCGVCIAPPIVGYYSGVNNLESLHDFLIGKYFDVLGIRHNLFMRWGENE
ncbi:3-octaprenyl-4-hydroxybenzoate carboxy-lyase [Helicobacter didelphidarum]|uniref:3-octaprenyl-4-hydroxybenzoate carboxy-lyase n=1 Tax=Helicobacter didelphidarum TaxID=2040648 RepID=A0A3D8IRV2_9HELI|nr:UbiX family flavin prenyltransferase [Helicobacter didelphidarum]RDU67666.1 3-octaprenyl-4-hydroxybenzoate carboxy-lyase [Helicobacter didelphidarum]